MFSLRVLRRCCRTIEAGCGCYLFGRRSRSGFDADGKTAKQFSRVRLDCNVEEYGWTINSEDHSCWRKRVPANALRCPGVAHCSRAHSASQVWEQRRWSRSRLPYDCDCRRDGRSRVHLDRGEYWLQSSDATRELGRIG